MPADALTAAPAVTLDVAQSLIAAARAKAEELGVKMNVAVVDAGANLVAFARMDGAWLGSVEIAQNKAYTARAFDMSTKELAEISGPRGPAFGLPESTGKHLAIFPGGIPLKRGGTVVGAIGASGGLPDQDHQVAQAGAAAFVTGSEQ